MSFFFFLKRFARGTYSYIGLNSEGKDYDRLAQPVANRLFFGGEATMRAHPATAAGAYLSGLIQAGLIDELLSGKIELDFDVESLTREWELENSSNRTPRRRYVQKHEMKKSFQRGKKGLRIKETRLTESYSWLFSTSYRIPKRKASDLISEPSSGSSHPQPSAPVSLPKVNSNSSSELILSTRRNLKEQRQQRIITKSSLEDILQQNNNNNNSNIHSNHSGFPPGFASSSSYSSSSFPNLPIPVPPNLVDPSSYPPFDSSLRSLLPSAEFPSSLRGNPIPSNSFFISGEFIPTRMNDPSLLAKSNHYSEENFLANDQTKDFKRKVGDLVVNCLCKYYSKEPLSKDEFKHLARKLTHLCLNKEKKSNNSPSYVMTEEVKKKIKKFTYKFLDQLKQVKNKQIGDNSHSPTETIN